MRIALLGHSLRVAGGLSVGKNIIATLPKVAPQHVFLATVPSGAGYEVCEAVNLRLCPTAITGTSGRMLFDNHTLPRILREFAPDLIWGLGNTGLVKPPCRQAVLFQDAHLLYPVRHYALETAFYKIRKRMVGWHLARCLPRTERIFCQTDTMRKRFAEVMQYDISRIGLCPNAISSFATIPPDPQVPEALRPYSGRFRLLLLTKYYAHKNIEGVVEAYERFEPELRDTVCVLTIEPSQGSHAAALLDRIHRRGLADRILSVGALKQEQLGEYYLACDAVLLPTLLESFSATYLEAMHFGRPIITSDLDFARDVCGKAAAYFDPWNPAAIKQAIVKLRDDLAWRTDLACRGKARMESLFRSWPDILRGVADELGISHDCAV